jgi:hypothetical protein
MWARMKLYHEGELKQGVELVLDEPNLRIKFYHMHNYLKPFSIDDLLYRSIIGYNGTTKET